MYSVLRISVFGALIALDWSSQREDVEGEAQWERWVCKALLIKWSQLKEDEMFCLCCVTFI